MSCRDGMHLEEHKTKKDHGVINQGPYLLPSSALS